MGQRITQRIHECDLCQKIPENGEYMWYMGHKIWCEECYDKNEEAYNQDMRDYIESMQMGQQGL